MKYYYLMDYDRRHRSRQVRFPTPRGNRTVFFTGAEVREYCAKHGRKGHTFVVYDENWNMMEGDLPND